jgi:hypothetical protein
MNGLKSIISVLLLLIYTNGFAHQLIPHCQEIIAGDLQATHHHHQHHEHEPNDRRSHVHIDHKDHVDAGLLDHIICVLSDLEHQAHHCILESLASQPFSKNYQGSEKAKWVVLLIALMLPEPNDAPKTGFAHQAGTPDAVPHLAQPSPRGPPHHSC